MRNIRVAFNNNLSCFYSNIKGCYQLLVSYSLPAIFSTIFILKCSVHYINIYNIIGIFFQKIIIKKTKQKLLSLATEVIILGNNVMKYIYKKNKIKYPVIN